ncbi:hypothetical protein EUGRSUZ_H03268 [Eucalyptus grandis]|uniref:Uncharacterized protein n=2 Tax=Eucalyptus grandis TaxID=71139 RepID=A0ACC3JXC2_EUCGR|nr:hypothetical protein EUGRSUZ_H03268 [Eucalyptus grandis]
MVVHFINCFFCMECAYRNLLMEVTFHVMNISKCLVWSRFEVTFAENKVHYTSELPRKLAILILPLESLLLGRCAPHYQFLSCNLTDQIQ